MEQTFGPAVAGKAKMEQIPVTMDQMSGAHDIVMMRKHTILQTSDCEKTIINK